MSKRDVVKVSFHATRDTLDAIHWLATTWGTTRTMAIKNAIALFKFATDARLSGSKILLEKADGKLREVVWDGWDK